MDIELGAPKVLELVLKLKQYPLLSREIRERMRTEIFHRGVITRQNFEREVRQRAHDSQLREGYPEAAEAEPAELWEQRLSLIRDDLTDFYFAHNCPAELLEALVQESISKRKGGEPVVLTVNPELAPWALLFSAGERYESLPPEERAKVAHHLKESIVVLTKGMISDQLDYVGIAGDTFTIEDLKRIRARRIGRGKIGGKAAGLLLASKILKNAAERGEISAGLSVPDSWFIAADVYYEFQALNGIVEFRNQKYRSREEIESDYPLLKERFRKGNFPLYVVDAFKAILEEAKDSPLVVRSSSLLEDNFGFSFAGKYESLFLVNRGSQEERLRDLREAVAAVYASTLSPDALAYRKKMGLLDYDERMAVLIQRVVGRSFRDFHFPALSGVAFSKNPFRWHPKIRRDVGMVRLVMGLGTRAVDRHAGDYPRMIALSHPELRPESEKERKKYCQKSVDLLDLRENAFATRPIGEFLSPDFPGIGLIASISREGVTRPLLSRIEAYETGDLVPTFDGVVTDTDFAPRMNEVLVSLEKAYRRPVDVEFAVERIEQEDPSLPNRLVITLLQCRPLSLRTPEPGESLPKNLPAKDLLFTANRLIPDGTVRGIRYLLWIDPMLYRGLSDNESRAAIARAVGKVNAALEGDKFILLGPGRWGSSNPELGVKVSYADIDNAKMLVEIAFLKGGSEPEVSYGTHFFQDLVESGIHSLALYPDDPEVVFNAKFFAEASDSMKDLVPSAVSKAAKLIDLERYQNGLRLNVVMNGDEEKAVGYLTREG